MQTVIKRCRGAGRCGAVRRGAHDGRRAVCKLAVRRRLRHRHDPFPRHFDAMPNQIEQEKVETSTETNYTNARKRLVF